jgi:hypothetical protein
MYNLTIYQSVILQPEYQVLSNGEYDLLDLVPCGLKRDDGKITCAFLTATCVGINLEDQYNNN